MPEELEPGWLARDVERAGVRLLELGVARDAVDDALQQLRAAISEWQDDGLLGPDDITYVLETTLADVRSGKIKTMPEQGRIGDAADISNP